MDCQSSAMQTSKVSPFLYKIIKLAQNSEIADVCFIYHISFWSGSLIVGSLEHIYNKEGMRGLYRGLSPTVMALLSNWAVSF